jgi:hypothetical protein
MEYGKRIIVTVDWDDIHRIVRDELIEQYNDFQNDYDKAKRGKDYIPVFKKDPKKDMEQMKEMMKALKLIINYYSAPEEKMK